MNRTGNPLFPYRLVTLFFLYVAQGLPYGFFITVLPVFLREAGWSRTSLGLMSLLGLPWFFKPLWAPLVDRFSVPFLGRRKSWILPCMGALALSVMVLGAEEPAADRALTGLFLVAVMILITATQDIAVDGLAVDILHPGERGPGNAAQVIGFKVGMLLTGGVLLSFSLRIGWEGICHWMAAITMLVMLLFSFFPEKKLAVGTGTEVHSLGEIVRSLGSLFRRPGFPMALLLIATYKMGEAGVDAMYKIFLLDQGLSPAVIGRLCGGWGLVFSLGGSLAGGWIGMKRERMESLVRVGFLRALPLAAIAALPFIRDPLFTGVLYPVTLAEHFAGGMITPVMFAFMMDLCDRRTGATHFAALAAVELFGKISVSSVSGLLADWVGYGGLFVGGAVISLLWPFLVIHARKKRSGIR